MRLQNLALVLLILALFAFCGKKKKVTYDEVSDDKGTEETTTDDDGPKLLNDNFKKDQTVYTTVNSLRIRTGPDLKSKTLGSMKKHKGLKVIGYAGEPTKVGKRNARWVKFKFKKKIGYTYAGFLTAKEPDVADDAGESKAGCEDFTAKDYTKYKKKCGKSNIAKILNLIEEEEMAESDAAAKVSKKKCGKWIEYYIADELNGCF